MLQLTVNSFSTVDSITFVLYKSHFSVCTFDHMPMLKYAVEGLNIIITSSYLVGCSIMFSSIMRQTKSRLAPYRGLIQGVTPPPSPGDGGVLEYAETLEESVLLYAWLTTELRETVKPKQGTSKC